MKQRTLKRWARPVDNSCRVSRRCAGPFYTSRGQPIGDETLGGVSLTSQRRCRCRGQLHPAVCFAVCLFKFRLLASPPYLCTVFFFPRLYWALVSTALPSYCFDRLRHLKIGGNYFVVTQSGPRRVQPWPNKDDTFVCVLDVWTLFFVV